MARGEEKANEVEKVLGRFLEKQGRRFGKVHRQVWTVVNSLGSRFTADEFLQALEKEGVGRASAYRTLGQLVDAMLLEVGRDATYRKRGLG